MVQASLVAGTFMKEIFGCVDFLMGENGMVSSPALTVNADKVPVSDDRSEQSGR